MPSIDLIDVSHEYQSDDVDSIIYDIYCESMKRFVGRVEFRDEKDRDLLYYGNIGYVIYLPYRGNGFALKACQKMLKIIPQKYPKLKDVYITCNPDNMASQKTIKNLGAQYIKTVAVASDHELYDMGETHKEIYRLLLTDNS